MALTIKEVEHVAMLARLSLTEEEKKVFAEQLGAILGYVEKLNELSTEGVEPLAHILPVFNVFREDEVKPSPPREEIMANGPLTEDGYYKVPKIV
ncbi:aspartyl/glutamyl-tRNA(Asn/Gln) amidotransferase subunit C [Thermosyntropha lipolytica DSM 11003]|uniref:Aspartyl/glutamyl-tRNA(Asn/Gln) amidotransferase subunit C n=1 Tax=Thermosyntropha lipolytica DSM 11003 TaxID=1123382 RepID=A0A1M5M6R7_9FIRM|nr:Asp-tRNA(Asn)/Glu-tRNA(Gln) amidotransferase subunit GatC [Thermosyntropha lipolytica]SHG72948.1 aspartyl/glutamyl-tRNA(Asn/Gln) amidotransferase subunit C [Thermosyntropha lipolytica DSM 11003]